MQLSPHLAQVQEQLRATAALGDDRTREIATALAAAAAPAMRFALLGAVTDASDEITAALLDYPASPAVSVRLDGDEVAVDVRATEPEPTAEEPRRDEGDTTARISLRLSDSLKAEIDAAAERDGVSVNTWLMRAASAALRQGPNGSPPGSGADWGGRGRSRRDNQHRITGWING
ncbi:MAG: hypothetical protein QOC66_696 [Pseudonocardiales bacterium]|jgi:hypothetical protein|nr:hypothetical protein [Pseudonocardiales bacterium]